ncbi:Crp/Fnr family transcriptional regulator [Mesobacterium sp. TK19101]|uniref:Crp/Fnr family transcriptional regulator n=1 Tax=Mesobacterium hydrothermale TaxID=3111907 RepID=A0ABU6HIY1_9RHOB|nr:Crp/Fnr family transcriptional regulator [Mesobacterium sp. TK19101]MEC3861804.1 Crp/Fnr family transcriptional regulator [Mesobacterium sp. TK19101]
MNAINQTWLDKDAEILEGPRPALFRGLSVQDMDRLYDACQTETYVDGQTVRRPQMLGLVEEGALREDMDTDGVPRLFALTFRGELVAPHGPRTQATRVHAMGETRLLTCESGTFSDLCVTIPRLRLNVLQLMHDQLDAARNWHLLLGRKTAAERMASLLYDVYRRQGCPDEIAFGLSRAEIGQMLGLTLETASRQLRALQKAEIVSLPSRGTVCVLEPQRLLLATGDMSEQRRAA